MARVDWKPWDDDPVTRATGVSFNRESVDRIVAPPGFLRVCAWHVDFDERPVCYTDAATLADAKTIADRLPRGCSYNVDYGTVHDEQGAMVYGNRPW